MPKPRFITAAVVSSALLAACGSSSSTTSTDQSAAAPPAQGLASAAFKHDRCMRDHGVADLPAPQVVVSPGHVAIRQSLPPSLVDSPQFKAAQKACRGILPSPGNVSPAQVAQQQHARQQDLLAFARCLRGHGIRDFPDPTPQGQLTLQMVTGAGVDLHAPALLSAAKACIGDSNGAITPADVERAVNGTQ